MNVLVRSRAGDVDSALAGLIDEAWRLLESYRERSDRTDLDRAEPLLRRALVGAADAPVRANALAAMAELLVQRVRGGHGSGSLNDAVDLARAAADLVEPGDPSWPTTRAHLRGRCASGTRRPAGCPIWTRR